MTYFAFVSQYFQDQSINIVGFDLCYRGGGQIKNIFFSPTKTELQLSNAILPCKTAFLSHKHNNDRDNEQTLIREQITEKMSCLCWTTLRPRPLLCCLWTHRSPPKPHSVTFTRSSSQSHLKQKMFSLLFC